MNFYIARILKSKAKYLTMMVIIGFVYFAIYSLSVALPELYANVYPKQAFDIENVYELKSLQDRTSFLGLESNVVKKVLFDEPLVRELENTDGVRSVCLSGSFLPTREIYWNTPLNDSIENFMLYSLGEGFDKVLKLNIEKAGDTEPAYPAIFIETTLAGKLRKSGMNEKVIEFGNEKKNYKVAGTFQPIGVTSKRIGPLYLGIEKVSEASSVLIRFAEGANIEKAKASIYDLLTARYEVDQSAFDLYPLNIYGKDTWFEMKNQIISMLILALVLLFYVMLALLGLYWNETKSRNAEIGLMRAVGFTKMQVFGLFIKETTIISAVAIVFAQVIIVNVYPEGLKSPGAFLVSLVLNSAIVLGIVWLSVFIPAVKSSKIQPAQALSEE